MKIVATMFFPPNGEHREFIYDVSDDLTPQWEAIIESGARVTVEVLRLTNQASICIDKPDFDDFDSRIVMNMPDTVRAAMEELIRNFTTEQYQEWYRLHPDNPANE